MTQGSPADRPNDPPPPGARDDAPRPADPVSSPAWALLDADPERLAEVGGMTPSDEGRVYVVPDVADAFRRLGLTRFGDFLKWQGDQHVQRHAHHWNCKFRVTEDDGRERTFYLKRTRNGKLTSWLRGLVCGSPQRSSAHTELAGVLSLLAQGIGTVRPVAWGQRRVKPWTLESFFISEELPDAVPLDDFMSDRFTGTLSTERLAEKRRLARHVADLVRRFHEAGLNHQDLYCSHVFVGRGDERPLYLIDLHRVQHRRWLRHRWVVKDLGQLSGSTPDGVVTLTDRMRFWKRYRGIAKLGPVDKAMFRWVRIRHNLHDRKRRRRAHALAAQT